MRLPKIEVLQPRSLEEAASFLSRYGKDARVLAGGTDLTVSLKQRVYTPQYLVNLKTIGDLNYIRKEKKEVRIGALTPLKDLEISSLINKECLALRQAASRAASPQLRNMGTIGGNICLDTRCMYYNQSLWWRESIAPCLKYGGETCHAVKGDHCYAVFQADTPPALIALGAVIRLRGAKGERTIPLEDSYQDNGKAHLNLQPAEILAEVIIPLPAPRSAYQRMSLREAVDFPMVGSAVGLRMNKGICEGARVVLGAVNSCPVRTGRIEEFLKGKKLTDEVIAEASALASKDAKPVNNLVDIPATYRRKMAEVMTRRAIKAALEGV